MSYELTPQAQRDLNEAVYHRASVAGIVAASHLLGKFYNLFDLIGMFGVPGAERPEIIDPPHRVAVQDTFLIIWRPASDNLDHRVIVDIVDGRRDVSRLLSSRGD